MDIRISSTTLAALAALTLALPAEGSTDATPGPQEPVRVVATLPVYASIVDAIGGDQVRVTSISDPREDAHFVRPKPSFALDLRRADLFITTGLDLELWVPALLDKANNTRVLEGGPGYVTAYTGVRLLEVPASADRSQGDIHIYGNPHLHTDPARAVQVARNITTGLKRVAPERSARWDRGFTDFRDRVYRELVGDRLVELLGVEALEQLALGGNLWSFISRQEYQGERLVELLDGWLGEAREFRGRDIICYHKDWAYFEERFGVRCAAFVETKPGIPPTPRHVAELIALMRDRGIPVVIAPNYYSPDKVEQVARRGGATAAVVAFYPGGGEGVDDYFDLVDRWIAEIDEAFEDAGEH